MKVISLNVNGIRSAYRKEFGDWLLAENADVVCLQEVRAQIEQLDDDIKTPKGYYGYFKDAQKKGYSGVAIYSRIPAKRVVTTLGWELADQEGRYIQLDFGNLSIASIYLPSGTSGEQRQNLKICFMKQLLPVLQKMRRSRRKFIICGDWNIAHRQIDLKNWRGNQKNSGFLPAERSWLDQIFNEVGMVDAFRVVDQRAEQYTWWSNRGRSWDNNVGWRIDYQIITPNLKARIQRANIYKDQRFSDHAPLIIEYDHNLDATK